MPRVKKVKDKPEVFCSNEIIQEIERLYPLHPGQEILREQVFQKKKKRIFAQCGRNWGKSVWIARTIVEYACLNENTHCFIIAPEKTQGREIYWDSRLLLSMIPEKLLAKNFLGKDEVTKSELRIRLTNGSFIKILGADEPKSLRGIKPHICAFDEYRDFKEEVYWSMEANLLGKGATLLIGSTPPDVLGSYSEIRDHYLKELQNKNGNYFYLELPTETNPHIDKVMLAETKQRLVAHGRVRVWEREYMAKFIPGGASSVFPMFAERKEEIVKPAYLIQELIKNERDALEFYCSFDPATSSVFAVLLCAINKFTGTVYVLDEIYERDRMRTGSLDIWKRASKLKSLYQSKLNKWENIYDEHEAWFERDIDRSEILGDDQTLEATNKQSRNKEEDLGTIKDLMLAKDRYFISEKCKNYIEEIESCATDKNNKIIKKKDHNIDNQRYILVKAEFSLNEQPDYEEYLKRIENGKVRPVGFDQYIKNRQREQDWTTDVDESESFDNDEVVHLEDMGYGEIF